MGNYPEGSITVKELKERLKLFPDNATVFAYEGETTGINIVHSGEQLAFITAWAV